MFHKLRKQFIIATMAIVTAVLIVTFTVIYLSSDRSFNRDIGPPPGFSVGFSGDNTDATVFFNGQHKVLARRSLSELRTNLIIAAVVILVIVYIVSRYIADRAVSVIEEAYLKQRQFIADASHELKTPIAIIGTNAEAAMAESKKPSKWLGNIKSESERMGRLVSDLLTLAKLDTDTVTHELTSFDVSEMLSEVSDGFKSALSRKHVVLAERLEKPLVLVGDEDKIKQILTILVDNAAKYTKSGGKVTIASQQTDDDEVILSVTNTFEQVSADELDKFFERFYQADASHRTNGHGLGLAIAMDIAKQIGAGLEAESGSKTMTFSLRFLS